MAQLENGSTWNYQNIAVHEIQRRHTSFVRSSEKQECYIEKQSRSDDDACIFVKSTETCSVMVHIFNYLELLTCKGHISLTRWGMAALVMTFLVIATFWIAFMFLITKYFLLPNVIHVAQYMRMPLYDFGLTVIAVIMSTPQIKYILQECNFLTSNGTLMLSTMMGRLFTTYTIGLSVVCFHQHTKIPGGEVIKHIVLSMGVLILSYVLILKNVEAYFGNDGSILDVRPVGLFLVIIYVAIIAGTILSKRRRERHSSVHSRLYKLPVFESQNGWTQLWYALNPFQHMEEPRYVIALYAPLWVLSSLQVPVIEARRQMYGWCKYLTCLNIIIFPCLLYAELQHVSSTFVLACFLSLILLITTVVFTNVKEPPKYHGFFAVLGIFLGFFSYYVIKGELETVLWQSFSYIFNVPSNISMFTGQVFHYVLNLALLCHVLARVDLGNLAFGIIIGITLNQTFLLVPILTFQICTDYDYLAAIGANTTTCFGFTILTFLASILCISVTDFKLRISQGIYFVSIYGLFLLYLTLSGLEIIHPFGAVHSTSLVRRKEGADWA